MSEISAIVGVNGRSRLTPGELAEVARLAARDREVRAHEAQHAAMAGGMARGVQYKYETGPDGRLYAVEGSVQISVPASRSPEEALAKARQLRAAATATSDPSGQDMAVASKASQMEARALQQIASRKIERQQHGSGPGSAASFGHLDQTA